MFMYVCILKDAKRSGRPQKIDHAAVVQRCEEDPCLTSRQLGAEFGAGKQTILDILHKAGERAKIAFARTHAESKFIGKRYLRTRWVPHELNAAQKRQRVEYA